MTLMGSIEVFCDNFYRCGSMESLVRNGRTPTSTEVDDFLRGKGWKLNGAHILCPKCGSVI